MCFSMSGTLCARERRIHVFVCVDFVFIQAAEAALATSSKAAAQMTTQPNGDKPPQVPAGSAQKSTEAQQKPTETLQKPSETAQKPAETAQKAAESTSKATTIVVDAKVWAEALNASALIEVCRLCIAKLECATIRQNHVISVCFFFFSGMR